MLKCERLKLSPSKEPAIKSNIKPRPYDVIGIADIISMPLYFVLIHLPISVYYHMSAPRSRPSIENSGSSPTPTPLSSPQYSPITCFCTTTTAFVLVHITTAYTAFV
jgi:hypothetical protein